MNKSILLIQAIAFFFLVSCSNEIENRFSSNNMCGPICLKYICDSYGMNVDLYTIKKMTKHDEKYGTNMLNIYNVSKKLGFILDAKKIDIEELKNTQMLKIIYFNNHYSVIRNCDSQYVYIIDPTKNISKISLVDLNKIWHGEALIYKDLKEESTVQNGPVIKFKSKIINYGTIVDGEIFKATISFRNTGTDSLKIYSIRAGCACTETEADKRIVLPNETSSINVSFDTAGKPRGYNFVALTITTNDPNNKEVQVIVEGLINRNYDIIPEKINIGKILCNQTIKKSIKIIDSNDSKLQVYKAICKSSKKTKITRTIDLNQLIYNVELEIAPMNDYGAFRDTLYVFTNLNRNIMNIPISGIVVSQYQYEPSEIFIQDSSDNIVNAEVEVSGNENEILYYERYEIRNMDVIKELKIKNNKLLLKIQVPRTVRVFDDTLKIFYRNGIKTLLPITIIKT